MDSPFHFRTTNNATVWIFNVAQVSFLGKSLFFYNLAIVVEVVSAILCISTMIFFGVKALLHPPLHINLVLITMAKFLLFTAAFIARFLIILYESGVLFVPDFGTQPLPLLNKIRLLWVIAVFTYNGPVFLERYAATHFVCDYERNRRIYIAFILIIVDFALILGVVCIVTNALVNEYAFIFFVFSIPNVWFFMATKWLLKKNQQRLNLLNNLFSTRRGDFSCKSRDVYTLSIRLQLDENIWCLRQISAGNVIYFVAVIGSGAIVAIPPLFSYSADTMWILQSFVVFTNMAMPFVSLLVIVSIGLSLDRFRVLILPQWIMDRMHKNTKRTIEETPRHRIKRVEEEGNVYFSHLVHVWETDFNVRI